MKGFMKYVVYGAAMTLGGCIINGAIKIGTDPYERAVVKQKVNNAKNNIKDIFKNKEES